MASVSIDDIRAPSGQDELSLIAITRMLWTYKFVIIGITLLGIGIALVVALTAAPIYRAEVVVTAVTENDSGGSSSIVERLGGLASIAGATLGATPGANPQAQAVLRSRRLVEDFIKRYDLLDQLRAADAPPPTLWFAVRDMQNNVIAIREEKSTNTTIVAFDWKDPKVAARWANDFLALANEVLRTRAMDESTRSIAFLNGQVSKTNVLEVQRSLYQLIERETKKLTLANTRPEYAFAVVDPAVPPEVREWPRRSVIMMVGTLLGLVFGVLAAFALSSLSVYKRRLAGHG